MDSQALILDHLKVRNDHLKVNNNLVLREAPGSRDLVDGLDGQGGDALAADARAAQLLGGGRGAAALARQDADNGLRRLQRCHLKDETVPTVNGLRSKRYLKPQDEQLVVEEIIAHMQKKRRWNNTPQYPQPTETIFIYVSLGVRNPSSPTQPMF